MIAAYYTQFQGPITLETLPDPTPPPAGVVLAVRATGLCRSDWHGWMGHDPDITLPHVPGHELAGEIVALGPQVTRWQIGDRVTLPFVCGCGRCPQCAAGQQQVCDRQFQPGFTHWGSFAETVAIDYADHNLVRLPDSLDFVTAASLGCRFVTAFRALIHQGRLQPGEWVAVHGCGGVGLSAILIAKAAGAHVVAVDISNEKLDFATEMGADAAVNARLVPEVVTAVRDLTGGGVHLSLDALGSQTTCFNSIANLRKRGRHVQVGLMTGSASQPHIPMAQVIAHELEILGSHGMPAHAYPPMLEMIESGLLQPARLISQVLSLKEGIRLLPQMDHFPFLGVAVMRLGTVVETLR